MAKMGRPPKVKNEWAGKTGLKVNLGSGANLMEGFINVDLNAKADLKLDLEDGKLPFDNESCTEIHASHVLEHLHNLIPLINECHRCLVPGGKMFIAVPCYPSPETFQDPTHVRFFTTKTFNYFDERDNLFRCHEYGITGWKFQFTNLEAWNLRVELWK